MLAAILDLPAPWSSRASPVVIQTLAAWLEPLYSSVFFVACILPILLVTLLLSSAWYQEIADVTFALDGSVKAAPKRPAWEQAAEVIYRTVVVLAYVVLQVVVALLLCAVPFVGPHLARAVDMILTAWYFAFLCFEYKWINIGSDLSKRIIIFHARWAYFAGFGLPFTLLCYFFSFAVSNAVFFLAYPFFVIMATKSRPLPVSMRGISIAPLPTALPIFQLPCIVANPVIKYIDTRLRSIQASRSPSIRS